LIADGTVIPRTRWRSASRALDTTHQRADALLHRRRRRRPRGRRPPQFAIRDVGLYRPVLELAAETAAAGQGPLALVAGLAGRRGRP
jgi:hypothetical protein